MCLCGEFPSFYICATFKTLRPFDRLRGVQAQGPYQKLFLGLFEPAFAIDLQEKVLEIV